MTNMKVPESQVEELVQSGDFEFPEGTRVNVINPQGEAVSLPSEQLRSALANGYKYETAFQGAVRKTARENSGFQQALKVFGAQAADEFAMGIPEMGFDKKADPFTLAVKEQIKKDHEIANTLGGVAGFAGSLFYGGPLGKLMGVSTKAGVAAERVVANQLAKVGVERGSKSLAKQILARTAENSAKFGTEGLIAASPIAMAEAGFETMDAIDEKRLGDYEAAAESLMLGGGLGLAFGVVSGPVGAIFNKLKRGVDKAGVAAFDKATANPFKTNGVATAPNPEVIANNLPDAAAAEGFKPTIVSRLKDEATKLKPEAKEIAGAAERLQVPVTEGMLSASESIQKFDSALAKKASPTGIAHAKKYEAIENRAEEVIRQSLGVADLDQSRFQVGNEIKSRIVGRAKAVRDEIGAVFNELRMDYKTIPIKQTSASRIANNIRGELKSVFDNQTKGTLKNIADFLDGGGLTNLDELKSLRTKMRNLKGTNREQNAAIDDIISKMNDWEERIIDKSIDGLIADTAALPPEVGMAEALRLKDVQQRMRETNKQWAGFMEQLQDAADDFSLRSVKNPRDFIEQMENLSPEQFVRRMTPKNDMGSMLRMKEQFPEEFDLVSNFKKAELLESARVGDKFSARSFIRKFSDLEPEAQKAIFGDDAISAINDLRTIYRAIPRDINPSGTSAGISWMNLLTPEGLATRVLSSVGDEMALYGINKAMNVEGILMIERQMKFTSKAIDAALEGFEKTAKAVRPTETSKKAISAILQLTNETGHDDKAILKKLQERLGQIVANPIGASDEIASQLQPLDQSGAPQTATALAQKLTNSVLYIYNNIPKNPNVDSKLIKINWAPSSGEMASFNRKLAVVVDPMTAIEALGAGTLTKDHVEALAFNYPRIYSTLRERVFNWMSEQENLPYNKRLSLSLLLGLDGDPSLNPQSIARLQGTFQGVQGPQQPEANTQKVRASGLNKMNPRETHQTDTQRLLSRT